MIVNRLFSVVCAALCLLLASCGYGGESAVLETDSPFTQEPSLAVVDPHELSGAIGLGPDVPTMVTWRGSKVYLANLQTGKSVEMRLTGSFGSSNCFGAAISDSKRYLAVLYSRAIVRYDLESGSSQEVSKGLLDQTSSNNFHRIGWCQGDSTIYVLRSVSNSEGVWLEALTAGKSLPYSSRRKYLSRYVDILPNGDVLSLKTSTSRGVSIATAIVRMLGHSPTFETVEYPLSSAIALSSGTANSSTRTLSDIRADRNGRRLLLCFRHGVSGQDTLEMQVASLDGLVPNAAVNNTAWPLLHLTQRGRRLAALHPVENVLCFTSPVAYENQRSFTPGNTISTIYKQPFGGSGLTLARPSHPFLDLSSFGDSKNFGFNIR